MLKTHLGCCNEDLCPIDIHFEKKAKISDFDFIITTHAYLTASRLNKILPAGRTVIIDEIDRFFLSLCDPFPPFNSFTLNDLEMILSSQAEIKKLIKIKKEMLAMS